MIQKTKLVTAKKAMNRYKKHIGIWAQMRRISIVSITQTGANNRVQRNQYEFSQITSSKSLKS